MGSRSRTWVRSLGMLGNYARRVAVLLVLTVCAPVARGQDQPQAGGTPVGASTEEFEKQTQNPVANLIRVPFQDNTDLKIGPFSARSKHAEQERASGASSGRFRREDLPVRCPLLLLRSPCVSAAVTRFAAAGAGCCAVELC